MLGKIIIRIIIMLAILAIIICASFTIAEDEVTRGGFIILIIVEIVLFIKTLKI